MNCLQNESPWSRSYVKELRAALNENGMQKTQIVVPDGGSGGCLDCHEFGSDNIVTALANDPMLTEAVDVIGIHGHDVEGTAGAPGWENVTTENPRGLALWNSEQNLIDGPLPQWEPTEQNRYGSGLGWVRVFITNYVRRGATATILCPITHSFTWNYGRQNHGHSQFVEPWSGHFATGSAFWSQAHFTQFTRPGWTFLGGGGTGQRCDPRNELDCDTVWAALTDKTKTGTTDGTASNLTLVLVHTANASVSVEVSLGPGFAAGQQMARWETVKNQYFREVERVVVASQGLIKLLLPGRSVTTVSTLMSGKRADVSWTPPRSQFPLPFSADFDGQPIGAPGRMLSDVFGAFEVAPASQHGDEQATGNVLLQGAPTNPGKNAWSHFTNIRRSPFTSMPSGTNWMNTKFSVHARLLEPSIEEPESDSIMVCGRVPVWPPGNGSPSVSYGGHNITVPLGVCLAWQRSGDWVLTESATARSGRVIASGKHAAAAGWRRIEMSFAAYQLEISVDGVSLTGQPAPVTLGSGTSGVGSSWANVVFDNLTLTANAESTPGSFLFDCLPGQELVNLTGWAGMAVEAKATVAITRLGRYKTLGNRKTHAMGIFRASDHAAMLPSGSRPAVGMSCEADLLGFCWTAPFAPVNLVPGETYYIVAEETTDGDLATEMADAARMTTHAHRDGSTIMSYNNGVVEVTGRVAKVDGSWMVTPELDTSFGPVNFVVKQTGMKTDDTFTDIGNGYCVSKSHRRPETWLCDDSSAQGKGKCDFTQQSCAAVCLKDDKCTGFMLQDMKEYGNSAPTCQVVTTTKPAGPGYWTNQNPGSGLSIAGYDSETRDHCWKRGSPSPAPAGGGYTDIGAGFCTDGAGKRPQTFLCDSAACSFTAESCGALCSADAKCTGYMIQNMSIYNDPMTCNLVTTAEPSGGGHWSVQQAGNGLVIKSHDSESRDHCYKKSGSPSPPAPPSPPPPPPPSPPPPPGPPAPGTVSVTVDASASGSPFNHVWKRSFGSGHAAVGLRRDWQVALKRAADELGLRGVRQHGLLDDDIGIVVGHRQYNWTNVDALWDAIRAAGARPIVELSFMPSELANCSWESDRDAGWIPGSHNISRPGAKLCQTTLFYGGITAQPTNWDDWQHLVAALVQHAVDKFGIAEIRDEWAFEVWNELW